MSSETRRYAAIRLAASTSSLSQVDIALHIDLHIDLHMLHVRTLHIALHMWNMLHMLNMLNMLNMFNAEHAEHIEHVPTIVVTSL